MEKEKENIRYSKEVEEGFLPLLYPEAVDYAKNIIMLPDFSQTIDLKMEIRFNIIGIFLKKV